MLVVVALGGNALLRRGEPMTAEAQRENVKRAAASLAEIVRAGHCLVVTHGNGPQVGLLALQGAAYKPDEAYPLDVLGAETGGMIGYLIEQELENALDHAVPVVTLLTQIVVDPHDPAFANPTKPVGPVYDEGEARRLAEARGWRIAPDGSHWRRVVASPTPLEIPDLRVIKFLIEREVIVICTGGGGIPVVRRQNGSLVGIEAVIDKDRASALLAEELGADALLLLTDVEAVHRDWGTPQATPIRTASPEEIAQLDLPVGSMGPKVEAASRFVRTGGAMAGIGRLADAAKILERASGTVIVGGDGGERS
ncbi:carbamate kinase [Aurantimonas marianensis]|uniref:Carbamate kinase n=1 Tax=Aurantimonas marianensis TaxID=2920428 RepID=A0A9X2HC20_9HYPH|nr:carbamate kinase [Aurantimonas marianensis]MCP3055697.1 carbamate kinase [Aurantimonas marianensis]